MKIISASSYSNTAPLIWSFLYGSMHGKYELILDTAPARSAELLANDRVDAALVPVIAAQMIEGVRVIPDVCVGAIEKVRSVCLLTRGEDLRDVKSVSLDVSSKTSAVLTKIIFREFLGFEPVWKDADPDIENMLSESDCALLIGDPALAVQGSGFRVQRADSHEPNTNYQSPTTNYRKFDLVELWRRHTGFGFVFAMWMTKKEKLDIDFGAARDEGLTHLDEIVANYENDIPLSRIELKEYLTKNISFSVDESMKKGMELYFELARGHNLVP